MSVAQLIEAATAAGILFILDGERIRLRAPAPPPAELLAALRQHKAEIREYLRRSESARVGPWQPPGAVAPPRQCPSCRGGLTAGDPDNSICSTCRYYFAEIEPKRIQ